MSYGCVIEESKVAYLAVWKLKEGEDSVTINPLPTKWKEKGVKVEVSTYYPISLETKYQYEEEKQSLKIIMEEPLQARIFKIIIR